MPTARLKRWARKLSIPSSPPPGILSIYASARSDPPASETDSERMRQIEAIEHLHALGVRATYRCTPWDWLEAQPRTYVLSELMDGVQYAAKRGFKMLVNLQVIDTHRRRVPADLMNLPFDSPVMQERFRALLDVLLPQLPKEVLYLSLGNEVEPYLGVTREWLQYKTFLEESIDYIHDRRPGLWVGATVTFSGATSSSPHVCALVNERTDLYITTYYPFVEPFSWGYEVRPPSCPFRDFPMMIELAKGKPVIIQEAGYPAAPPTSSEANQAQFVRNVFKAWEMHRAHIPFLSFFQMHDFPRVVWDMAGDYYKDPANERLLGFISTLGMIKVDGSPRPSWQTFVEHVQRGKPPWNGL